jgi:hypothetical protein
LIDDYGGANETAEMDPVPKFSSPDEEIEFWKGRAKAFEQQAKEVKEEFEEFQVSNVIKLCLRLRRRGEIS